MKFETVQQRNNYFDLIIDTFKENNFETLDRLIIQLDTKQERELLYYLHTHKEELSPGLFGYVLDLIF